MEATNLRVSDTNILITSEMKHALDYENILRRNNFTNINSCKDGISALQKMEHEPPHILITDVAIPDMDGFELASNLREIEKTENRFTYIVMVSDENQNNKLDYSWQANVDSIIPRQLLPFRLIPQVMAGERLSMQTNRLLSDNSRLSSRCGSLEAGQLLDPLTGLGNRRQAMLGMEDTIKQIEARGGAICVLLVKINDVLSLQSEFGKENIEDVIVNVGHKIRRLVRPLDIVTYFDTGMFAIIMQHHDLEDCKTSSYARLRDGLALKSYSSRAGFLQPSISIGACGAGAETGPPKTSCLLATAISNLSDPLAEEGLSVSVLNKYQ